MAWNGTRAMKPGWRLSECILKGKLTVLNPRSSTSDKHTAIAATSIILYSPRPLPSGYQLRVLNAPTSIPLKTSGNPSNFLPEMRPSRP